MIESHFMQPPPLLATNIQPIADIVSDNTHPDPHHDNINHSRIQVSKYPSIQASKHPSMQASTSALALRREPRRVPRGLYTIHRHLYYDGARPFPFHQRPLALSLALSIIRHSLLVHLQYTRILHPYDTIYIPFNVLTRCPRLFQHLPFHPIPSYLISSR